MSWVAYPDHSCPTVRGMASCKWVRPILTTSTHAMAFSQIAFIRDLTLGIRWFANSSIVAICMAVGNVSLEDCDMLTWSLGWIGSFATKNTASQLNCTIGDHFIDIHVRLGTRASLPDVKWKLCIEFASDDLLGDFDNKTSLVLLQLASLGVDRGCSPSLRSHMHDRQPWASSCLQWRNGSANVVSVLPNNALQEPQLCPMSRIPAWSPKAAVPIGTSLIFGICSSFLFALLLPLRVISKLCVVIFL